MNILKVLEKKFTSGNDVPVTRATITREEYEAILEIISKKSKDESREIKEYMPPSTGGWLSPAQIEKDWPYEDEKGRYCLTYCLTY